MTRPVFNRTNENVDWARWTWNPVTGCLHGCPYCYARDFANRFSGPSSKEINYRVLNKLRDDHRGPFEPRFYDDRLWAPLYTKISRSLSNGHIKNRSVFVCSMGDLFGDWVPWEWIDLVMQAVREADVRNIWNYIFLTKNPKRYLEIDWPKNVWLGATADTQERAIRALKVFKEMAQKALKEGKKKPVTFLSCEPLLEEIDLLVPERGEFLIKNIIDWLIIGGQSRTSQVPEKQPEWDWVEDILGLGRICDIPVYFKNNLTVRPQEYPNG